MKVDLHIHSNASDGTDTPLEIMKKARQRAIGIFAITDHDTVVGLSELNEIPEGIKCIRGIELSSKTTVAPCHILGYGFDLESNSLKRAIEELANKRNKKTDIRIERLKANNGIKLTDEELNWIYSHSSPGRPHIAQILVNRGVVSSIREAFDKFIDDNHSPVAPDISRIEAKTAIEAITEAGGVACWAHPLGGEGEPRISYTTFKEQLANLTKIGIQGIECYYSQYSLQEINFLLGYAKENKLLVSGGSDYHGMRKNINLGELNSEGYIIHSDKLTVLEALHL